ncbi:hypothetical protein AAIR98_000744 [Elusimicrobium simillimum]|uniref:hypothetical protein n=1 Tax=Elusimicrobium simillimum TaxID=3143438 RepID=UPI003C6F7D0F
MLKKLLCAGAALLLLAPAFAQDNELQEYSLTVDGVAAPALLKYSAKVDILCRYTNDDGQEIAATILQNIWAVKAERNDAQSSTVTLLLDAKTIDALKTFKKDNLKFYFTLRNENDVITPALPSASFSNLFS